MRIRNTSKAVFVGERYIGTEEDTGIYIYLYNTYIIYIHLIFAIFLCVCHCMSALIMEGVTYNPGIYVLTSHVAIWNGRCAQGFLKKIASVTTKVKWKENE